MKSHLLGGALRVAAIQTICQNHYAGTVPAGKSHYFSFDSALVVFSIPANKNIAKFLLWPGAVVWELTRLYAPDQHSRNLLTQAISATVLHVRRLEPTIDALVSYADPNMGHAGTVYRAASWVYTGTSEEARVYMDGNGTLHARRAFHSGVRSMRKAEIEALGFAELKLQGKHRFARGLTRKARNVLKARFVP